MKDNEMMMKIQITKQDVDRWTEKIFKLKWYQKIYKKLFPIRFEVNQKVKEYEKRTLLRYFLDKTDKLLAWGDDIE